MTMRSTWKGAITFGLVNLLVKLYKGTEESETGLSQLHTCGAKVQAPRFCPACQRTIEFSEIVKGYEVSEDKYVVITAEELKALKLKTTRAVVIDKFVDGSEIDLRSYENIYYAMPDKGGAKAYALLVEAMTRAGVVAVGKVALRNKEDLVAIRPLGKYLVLYMLRWAEEIRSTEELSELPEVEVTEKETKLALQLVKAMTGKFQYKSYKNEYAGALSKLIEDKVAGRALSPTAEPTQVDDLVVQLMASLK